MIVLSALLMAAGARTTTPPSPVPEASASASSSPSAPAPATPPIGTPAPTPATAPSSPPESALPAVTPTPTPTPTPTATATPSPYHYRYVPRQPAHPAPGDPQIFAVYLNDKQLRSLGPIDIRVETTPAVVKVVSRSNGRDGVVPMISPGVFVAVGHLPKIPFIAEGMSLDLQFIATTADGRKTVVIVPVRLN